MLRTLSLAYDWEKSFNTMNAHCRVSYVYLFDNVADWKLGLTAVQDCERVLYSTSLALDAIKLKI